MIKKRRFFVLCIAMSFFHSDFIRANTVCQGEDCFPRSRKHGNDLFFSEEPEKKVVQEISVGNKESAPPTKSFVKKSFHGKPKVIQKEEALVSDEPRIADNIPRYLIRADNAMEPYKVGAAITRENEIKEAISGVRDGDILYASVSQKIKVSPQAPQEVRVVILSGEKRGSLLMGKASLDKELKRVFLDFTRFRNREDDQVYPLTADGLSLEGSRGIEGEYHTQEGIFFLAALVTNLLGNFTSAGVNQVQTPYGGWTTAPSVSNQAQIAVGATMLQQGSRLMGTADRAPEFTETPGSQIIKVIITSDAYRKI